MTAETIPTTPAPTPGPLPACPACSERRWKVDDDVTVRVAVVVGEPGDRGDPSEVLVDRAGGGPASLPADGLQGSIVCHGCGYEPDDAATLDAVYRQAQTLTAAPDAVWRVLTDYRQF